jgi:hypothetical protein
MASDCGWEIGEGNCRRRFLGEAEERYEKPLRISGFRPKNRSWDFPNTKQECYPLKQFKVMLWTFQIFSNGRTGIAKQMKKKMNY